jgi:excinuclease ABC subunit C
MEAREIEVKTLQSLLRHYTNYRKKIKRIECFDVAHISGYAASCSLVTFINGEPEKNLYRRFKIKTAKNNDFAMLYEAVLRRLKHISEWGKPDLILVDGGKGQVSAAMTALSEAGIKIPVVGLAKRNEEIVIPVSKDILGWHYKVLRLGIDNPAVQLLQRLRDEAHRFARAYHFKLRLKQLVA